MTKRLLAFQCHCDRVSFEYSVRELILKLLEIQDLTNKVSCNYESVSKIFLTHTVFPT